MAEESRIKHAHWLAPQLCSPSSPNSQSPTHLLNDSAFSRRRVSTFGRPISQASNTMSEVVCGTGDNNARKVA